MAMGTATDTATDMAMGTERRSRDRNDRNRALRKVNLSALV